MIPPVAASDRGLAQTGVVSRVAGVVGPRCGMQTARGMFWKVQPERMTVPYSKPAAA